MITPISHETDKRAPTARPALMETSCSPRVHASIDIEDYIALFIRSFTFSQMSKAKLASALPWREKVHDNKPHKMVSACKVNHFPAIFHHFRSFSEQSLLFSPLFKRNGIRDMRSSLTSLQSYCVCGFARLQFYCVSGLPSLQFYCVSGLYRFTFKSLVSSLQIPEESFLRQQIQPLQR